MRTQGSFTPSVPLLLLVSFHPFLFSGKLQLYYLLTFKMMKEVNLVQKNQVTARTKKGGLYLQNVQKAPSYHSYPPSPTPHTSHTFPRVGVTSYLPLETWPRREVEHKGAEEAFPTLPTEMCVHACSVAQFCVTLCDPMDCSPPGSSVHGLSQAR